MDLLRQQLLIAESYIKTLGLDEVGAKAIYQNIGRQHSLDLGFLLDTPSSPTTEEMPPEVKGGLKSPSSLLNSFHVNLSLREFWEVLKAHDFVEDGPRGLMPTGSGSRYCAFKPGYGIYFYQERFHTLLARTKLTPKIKGLTHKP